MKSDAIIIDATGKSLGRVASEAAQVLRGKNGADFERNKAPNLKLRVINVSALRLTAKKKISKTYTRYSGYPGGLKHQSMAAVVAKKGYPQVLRQAIHGMLPNNKLRRDIIKNLEIHG